LLLFTRRLRRRDAVVAAPGEGRSLDSPRNTNANGGRVGAVCQRDLLAAVARLSV